MDYVGLANMATAMAAPGNDWWAGVADVNGAVGVLEALAKKEGTKPTNIYIVDHGSADYGQQLAQEKLNAQGISALANCIQNGGNIYLEGCDVGKATQYGNKLAEAAPNVTIIGYEGDLAPTVMFTGWGKRVKVIGPEPRPPVVFKGKKGY